MTKMPALAALSVLLINCHHAPPAPKAPVSESRPATTAPEPAPEPAAEPANAATVPATRTAPAHDPKRCAMPTRAYPAWCDTIQKDRVKPAKQP